MKACGFGVSAFGEIIKKDGTRIPVITPAKGEKDRAEIPPWLAILLTAFSDIDISSYIDLIKADENLYLILTKCFNLTPSRTLQPRCSQQSQF